MYSRFVWACAAVLCVTCGCSKSDQDAAVVKEAYIHKYGVRISESEWKSRGEDGQIIQVLDSGETVVTSYSHGTLDGDRTRTFPHSKTIAMRETFSNGQLIRSTRYFDSGMPAEESRRTELGVLRKTSWYHSGAPKSVEAYEGKSLVNGEYYSASNETEAQVSNGNGQRVIYDAYGQLISKDEVQNGQILSSTTFHPNGNPKEITAFQNGKAHGLKKTYWPDGAPRTLEEWERGEQHGITTQFKNGQKWAEITYVEGERHGLEIVYRGHNVPVGQRSWEHDKLHGPSKTFVGEHQKTTFYLRGRQVSKSAYEKGTQAG